MNMNWDAAFAACKSYDDTEVSAALQTAVDAAGGLDWVTPGMRVALKLNLVSAMKPEQAATVHPAVVCALVRMLTARGAHVILGDSPGGLYTSAHLQRVYDATGLRAAEALGAELNEDFSVCTVSYPEALQARSFTMTAYLQQADAIIDVCKLKTHGMMGMTNAVKNFFGIIPGTMKPEYHYKYPKVSDFADMLVDLCEYCRPRLCICDAVVGMEGNGPTQGSARSIGCLIAAQSAHKLDLAACGLIGLMPSEVPTLSAAIRRGLCPDSAEKLTIFGEPAAFAVPDYKTSPRRQASFSAAAERVFSPSLPTASCSICLRRTPSFAQAPASAAKNAPISVRPKPSQCAAASRILTGRPVSTASAVRNSAQRARCRWDAVCLQSCWKRAELPEGALPEIPGIASGGSAYPNRKGGRTDASRVFMGSFYRYRRAGGVSAV